MKHASLVGCLALVCGLGAALASPSRAEPPSPVAASTPVQEAMMVAAMAMDYSEHELAEALQISPAKARKLRQRATEPTKAPLVVFPYPGGRHPRLGFLEGAVNPHREAKFVVFLPQAKSGYVVVDLPEAIWASGELIYLAHTHVPTRWDKQQVSWSEAPWELRGRPGRGLWRVQRLPAGIEFTAEATVVGDQIEMELVLKNNGKETLRDIKIQMCAMLGYAKPFAAQSNDNKIFRAPVAACGNAARDFWILIAWTDCGRAWGNAPCPCLHSDPVLGDCPPGETRRTRGRLSFYAGTEIDREMARFAAQLNSHAEPRK